MVEQTNEKVFTPTLSKAESKAEAADRIARAMIEDEVAKRDAKTARLREARLAREAAEAPKAGSTKRASSGK